MRGEVGLGSRNTVLVGAAVGDRFLQEVAVRRGGRGGPLQRGGLPRIVRGGALAHENTGKEVDEWGCSIAWLPHLLIENANQTRQAGAATESFRNEYVRAAEATLNTMVALSSQSPSINNEIPMKIVYDNTDDNKKDQ